MEDYNSLHLGARRLLQELSNLDQSNVNNNAERIQLKEALAAALSRLETP